MLRSVVVTKRRDREEQQKLRDERQQAKLLLREKSDDMGAKLELEVKAKFELVMDRPFMYALKCDENFLQIGRYSSPKKNSNDDISNRIPDKKFAYTYE